jgi:hypothetical protein
LVQQFVSLVVSDVYRVNGDINMSEEYIRSYMAG